MCVGLSDYVDFDTAILLLSKYIAQFLITYIPLKVTMLNYLRIIDHNNINSIKIITVALTS